MVCSVKGASQTFWNPRSSANTRNDKAQFPTELWLLTDCLQCLKSPWGLTYIFLAVGSFIIFLSLSFSPPMWVLTWAFVGSLSCPADGNATQLGHGIDTSTHSWPTKAFYWGIIHRQNGLHPNTKELEKVNNFQGFGARQDLWDNLIWFVQLRPNNCTKWLLRKALIFFFLADRHHLSYRRNSELGFERSAFSI